MASKGKEPGGADRRGAERHERVLPVRMGHDGGEGLRAESINISSRGLYCKVSRYVQPFSKLKVSLDLPFADGDPVPLECDGVVVRVEPDVETPGTREYRLAIYFLDLDPASTGVIETFLAETH